MKLIKILPLLFISLYSCNSNNDNSSDLPKLDIAKTINDESLKFKEVGLNYKETKAITLESTPQSLLGSLTIIGANDSLIVVNSNSNIYFFDSKNGRFKSRISKKGRGHGEYMNIWCGKIDFENKEIGISDMTSNKILTYTFDGNVVNSIANDSLYWFASSQDMSLGFNAPRKLPSYKYSLYDSEWSYIGGVEKIATKKKQIGGYVTTIPSLFSSNGVIYTANSDTISYLDNSSKRLKNLLVLDKGSFSLPSEIKTIENSEGYISADYFFIMGDNIYYRYLYQHKYHEELWDIKTQKLLYKKIHRGSFDKYHNFIADNSSEMGLPIRYNDKIVYGTPIYVENNKIYFTITVEETDSENPTILIATI